MKMLFLKMFFKLPISLQILKVNYSVNLFFFLKFRLNENLFFIISTEQKYLQKQQFYELPIWKDTNMLPNSSCPQVLDQPRVFFPLDRSWFCHHFSHSSWQYEIKDSLYLSEKLLDL